MTSVQNPITVIPSLQLSREQILQTTAQSLQEFGYDATTIRKIAGLLGCAVGSIYRYFEDKEELLSAVSQQILEPVAALVGAGGSFEQSVRLYHQLVTHSPETYRLMFWVAGIRREATSGGIGESGSSTGFQLPQVVQQITEAWSRQLNDANAARLCWSILHGCVLLGRNAEDTLAILRPIAKLQPTFAAQSGHLPEPTTMPPIVITMTEPPAPTTRQPEAAVIVNAQTEHRDDVCLL